MRVIYIDGDTPEDYTKSAAAAREAVEGMEDVCMDLDSDIWHFKDGDEDVFVQWAHNPLAEADSEEAAIELVNKYLP